MRRLFVLVMAVLMLATCMDTSTAYADEELVIVLDPGHDATHAGARANGVKEEYAVLKIGLYLQEELNKYQNVRVYMVREGEACAFPETHRMSESSKRCNEARVGYAQSVGADVIISLHLDYYEGGGHGASVLVQNMNYDANAGAISQGLGRSILNNIAELGIANNGIKTKNLPVDSDPSNYCYEDGTVADYYRVLRYAKKVHIPALIVEHAFLTSASDVAKVLATEEGIKSLAIKDAEGIVEYYGLTLKEGCTPGGLPDISVGATQTKPALLQEEPEKPKPAPQPEPQPQPEPEPQPEPVPEPAPETEVATELLPEETETELVPEETETEMLPQETENQEETPTNGTSTKISWGTIAVIAVIVIVAGIAGFMALKFYQKQKAEQ